MVFLGEIVNTDSGNSDKTSVDWVECWKRLLMIQPVPLTSFQPWTATLVYIPEILPG